MKSPLHILHLEDDPNDAALIQSTLEAEGITCATTCVQNRADFVAALEHGGIDLILSDFSLPTFDGFSAAELVRPKWPDIPLILVSGTLGEEQAIDSLKGGATDYVLKGHLARLVPAVRRAMQEVEERDKHQRAEKMIQSERDFSEASLNSLPGIFFLYDQAGKFLRWNRNFERISGYATEEIARMRPFDFFVGDERDYITKKIEEVFTEGDANAEAHFTARDGTRTPYYFTGHKIQMEGKTCLIGVGIDISEREKLEAQFIEAQKMEVIGHLASGVAHDFNNILAVIVGYSDLMMQDLGPDHPLRKHVEEIRHATERAAGLTRQLLVFSRRQTVQPVVLDLNDVVKDLNKMLRRLIDENIELTMVPGKQTGRVKADSGYVGQVLMNLVVNARDAMPKGGKLTIATNNVTLDENYARTHTGAIPGDYVMLSVSDTGTGMTDAVKAHLFEPFFTTKPKGKGTGLGLATCRTIVQQSGGHIGVYSEVGKGTTFKIYFPRVEQPMDRSTKPGETSPLPRGTETLLLVEDEPSVRHLTCRILESQGYNVLRANNGQDALHVAREHKGSPIRLVVTDVIMPLMGGKVMAEWLKTTYPDLKILFTSGYTDDAIAQHGVLETGVEFLSKPYTPAMLARKVREMLDNESDSAFLRKQGVTINQSPPGST
jgi:two-component system cell cycle sensor histidine kinase/response regulator CckA